MSFLRWLVSLLKRPTRGSMPPSGYYFSSSPDYGNHLAAIPREHELAHVSMDWADHADHARVAAEAKAHGFKGVIYNAMDVFFIRSSVPGSQFALRPDWKARWAEWTPRVREFALRGILHSIYIADEPSSHGLPLADLKAVNDYLHSLGYRTMVVEVMGHYQDARPAYDFFGLTCYKQDAAGVWSVDWAEAERRSKIAGANLVVGQAFQSSGAIPDPRPAANCARCIRAKAMLWFLWPTVAGVGKGAGSDPIIVDKIRRLCPRPGWR